MPSVIVMGVVLNLHLNRFWQLALFIFTLLATSIIEATPFIIDTDLGVDDAIAILYLLKQPEIEIKAITIVGNGSAHCQPALSNTFGILKMIHKTQIPIACGQAYPLQGNHHFPQWIIQETDSLAGAATLLPKTKSPSISQSAVDLLIKSLEQSDESITIVAIGPLTNIAQALQKKPSIKQHIRAIYIMGGALNVPGNIQQVEPTIPNKTAEWNIYIDPKAAQIVFNQKIPIILIPLDLTNQHPIDLNFYNALKINHRTPAASFIFTLLQKNLSMIKNKEWYFWDPLAAVIATDNSIAEFRNLRVRIRMEPEDQSGTIVIDEHNGELISVATQINAQRFKIALLGQHHTN